MCTLQIKIESLNLLIRMSYIKYVCMYTLQINSKKFNIHLHTAIFYVNEKCNIYLHVHLNQVHPIEIVYFNLMIFINAYSKYITSNYIPMEIL